MKSANQNTPQKTKSAANKPPKTVKPNLGKLPRWNLTDLYSGIDGADVNKDIARAEKAAKAFAKNYQGNVVKLAAADLLKAIREYEKIDEILGRLGTFGFLNYAENQTDAKRGQFPSADDGKKTTHVSKHLIFFTLEINKISDASYTRLLKDKNLSRYKSWLDAIRLFRPHQLPDEMEKMLHDKSVVGRASWNRLFDETLSGMKFDIDGKEHTISEVLNYMSSTDGVMRKKAATALGKNLTANIKIFALVTNTLAKDKEIDDQWRKYPRPVSSRNLANQVEDEVVDALNKAVKDSYSNLSHRYYKLKAGWFGKKQLDYWDRNAPIPGDIARVIPWNEAKSIVLDAYTEFSPELGSIGQQFFDKNWIDAPSTKGKDSGAFAHPCVPSVHPYIMLNYLGKVRDVMTLAHELGHGVHQYLAGQKQGHFLSDTPLTLAETASVFGEMLTFQSLLRQTTNKQDRKILLARKVEDMLATVVRQIAFYNFEERVHMQRRSGELLPDQIAKHWMDVQAESLGPAIKFNDDYKHYWAYIPHFIHTPFYVYAYAFGDCLVNALYAAYQEKPDGFQDMYFDLLSAGGTRGHKELLAPFGLNAADPKFWRKGLSVIEKMIDELETL